MITITSLLHRKNLNVTLRESTLKAGTLFPNDSRLASRSMRLEFLSYARAFAPSVRMEREPSIVYATLRDRYLSKGYLCP